MSSSEPHQDPGGGAVGQLTPIGWGLGTAFVAFIAAQVISSLWAQALVGALWGGVMPQPVPVVYLPVLNTGLWIGYIGGAFVVGQRFGRGWKIEFNLKASPRQYLVGVGAGIGTQFVIIPLIYLVLGGLVGDPGELAENLVERADGWVDVVVLTFALVIMAPIAEELMYRGVLLRPVWRNFGPVPAVVGTAALFAVVHPDPATYPGLFAFGLVLAGLAVRTGRIGVAVAAHMAFNCSTLVVLLLT